MRIDTYKEYSCILISVVNHVLNAVFPDRLLLLGGPCDIASTIRVHSVPSLRFECFFSYCSEVFDVPAVTISQPERAKC